MAQISLLSLIPCIFGAALMTLSSGADAADATTVGTDQEATARSSGKLSSSSSSSSSSKKGFKFPDFVYGGNAVSTQMPLQVGLVGYMPRVRLGVQIERQLHKAHWVHLGVAALLDRGDWSTFRMDACGLDGGVTGTCNAGTVAGFDLWMGYTHKWYLKKHPYIVPYARMSFGGGMWRYPGLRGDREQTRISTWNLSARGGGGVRLFLLRDLAVGLDMNLHLGLAVHKDRALAATESQHRAAPLLGLEILPLVVEYRF